MGYGGPWTAGCCIGISWPPGTSTKPSCGQELTERLGVRWQPVRNGMADIEGFTRPQIEAFSRRRHQLETWRQDQGLPDTPAARQVAVLATRQPKQDHPLAELEAEWQERAVEVGLTPDRLTRLMGASREVTPVDPRTLFERLASAEGLTERASTFGRAEVVKEMAAALPEGGTRTQIERLAETFLDTPDVVPVLTRTLPSTISPQSSSKRSTGRSQTRCLDRCDVETAPCSPAPCTGSTPPPSCWLPSSGSSNKPGLVSVPVDGPHPTVWSKPGCDATGS